MIIKGGFKTVGQEIIDMEDDLDGVFVVFLRKDGQSQSVFKCEATPGVIDKLIRAVVVKVASLMAGNNDVTVSPRADTTVQ